MNTKLYVGNLALETTEGDMREIFAPHGQVDEVRLIKDRVTGRPRGFGFATMNTEEAAKAALLALNGKDWKGKRLTVNEAMN